MKSSSVTPSVDRYAALKDLDEEFRETKAQAAAQAVQIQHVVAATTTPTNGNNVMGRFAFLILRLSFLWKRNLDPCSY